MQTSIYPHLDLPPLRDPRDDQVDALIRHNAAIRADLDAARNAQRQAASAASYSDKGAL